MRTALVPDPVEQPTMIMDDVADVIGVSRAAAYRAAAAGEIPTIRIGRRILVPTAALRRMLGLDVDAA